MRSDIDHPTALPGHMSITSARQGRPRRVRTQVMSANHASSGPDALKSRPTRSGAASACGAGALGAPLGRLAQPRVVPHHNLTVLREILKAFSRDTDDFDRVRDRPGHDRRYAIDSSKLRRELGWEPRHTDFAAGLAETIVSANLKLTTFANASRRMR